MQHCSSGLKINLFSIHNKVNWKKIPWCVLISLLGGRSIQISSCGCICFFSSNFFVISAKLNLYSLETNPLDSRLLRRRDISWKEAYSEKEVFKPWVENLDFSKNIVLFLEFIKSFVFKESRIFHRFDWKNFLAKQQRLVVCKAWFFSRMLGTAIVHTTLQSMMNAKVSKQRFWHCHENGLIKTIQTIPHNP